MKSKRGIVAAHHIFMAIQAIKGGWVNAYMKP